MNQAEDGVIRRDLHNSSYVLLFIQNNSLF